ncbi:Elongation factor 1-beta 1 [Apostasia shenzhenica]|uniref:Elongation factor 1-beta 1 n=1 Tax=Apostasia shenzhenica TaxID=1088818 RepID=A0A2I0ACD6_9ASPA|nr:Elongation factor 1-beta 1 [Apostasia shenzhenica]
MAISFSDLHTEAGLKSLDEFLSGKTYISKFPGAAVGVKIGGQSAASATSAAGETKKASSKKKESGKSSVLMDVKPWDDETDMKKLEEAVRSVQMPGLLWGALKVK